MRLIVTKNYEELSKIAAEEFANVVMEKPTAVLGLATGGSPVGMYKELIAKCENKELDFSKCTSINLDEYIGLNPEHEQSYRNFMNTNLFNHINIDKANTFVPNGLAENLEEECKNYDKKIEELGGTDVQLLGIGNNGHIAFNEPAQCLNTNTHVTYLKEDTIKANRRAAEANRNVIEANRKAVEAELEKIEEKSELDRLENEQTHNLALEIEKLERAREKTKEKLERKKKKKEKEKEKDI